MEHRTTKEYLEAITHNFPDHHDISPGACPGCETCGLEEDCSQEQLDMMSEGSFSWRACDCCGSTLGGNRYPAHWLDENKEIMHEEICHDCVLYLANGDLPLDLEEAD